MASGFVPPVYPYDQLDEAQAVASALDGGIVDLSIGTPCDPPPPAVVAALAASNAERGYPTSLGSPRYRDAAAGWIARRFGVEIDRSQVASCTPDSDTVLYPEVAYPTYEMGATLAGCRAVAVPVDSDWRLDLSAIAEEDAARALCLWINTPGNPAGGLDDLAAAAAWGRAHDVPVFSDECYAEFTWDGPPRSILEHGLDGVVAVHSLSKRSNLAGVRAGFYAGDGDLVHYLSEVRKHMGMMVPGPVQAAAAVALDDDAHVKVQRDVYLERLELMAGVLAAWTGDTVDLPGGAFYLWMPAPGGAWAFTNRLAAEGGALVSPGEFYGSAGTTHVRVAMVQPTERLQLVARRLGVS
jgi:aspartate/methionine/tyrosine aminotransferase